MRLFLDSFNLMTIDVPILTPDLIKMLNNTLVIIPDYTLVGPNY